MYASCLSNYRKSYWEHLIKSSLIENLVYFAESAKGDNVSGRETYGHSMIVGPWGKL